jgi:predicted amidohydrolase YtcJ
VGGQDRALYVRGRIYTGDWQGEAVTDALWVEDGVVRAIGPQAHERGQRGGGDVLELGAAEAAVPGFWDSHIHLADYGLSLDEVALGDLDNGAAILERLAVAVAAGEVASEGPIVGRGWMIGRWQGPPPHRSQLAPLGGRPVVLWNHDYHTIWVNDAALRLAGIDRTTADPAGGRIDRGPDGTPTGILRDAAAALVTALAPPPTPDQLERAILRAQERLIAMGVTAVCTMSAGKMNGASVRALIRLAADGRLRLRVAVYLPAHQVPSLDALGLCTGLGSDRLWLGGVKAFMDGALGSQTAWMREPYREVGGTGIAMPFAADLGRNVAQLRAAGLRLALHAIGDRAVAEAVHTLGAGEPAAGMDRIEHAQLVPPDVVAAWPAARLAASVQPIHLTDDIELTERFWGAERGRHAFPFAGLRARGVPLLFGSDAPVADPNPIAGLWAAVERRRPGGGVVQAAERITAAQALEAYAAAPARVEGRPHLGRLTVGSPLSLAVLSGDPVARPECLAELKVLRVETA